VKEIVMAEEAQRSRLGRGLAALIGDVGNEATPSRGDFVPRRAPLEDIRPNPRNPRRSFPDAELDELAASIRGKGLIQPVVVRRVAGKPAPYEIVAGERRWRAAQRAELSEIPIVLVDVDDKTSLEFAIIENVQREDLNAIEEATGYQNLIDEYNYTQSELANSLGKSRSHITNTLRLLKLPEDVKKHLVEGRLSAGHGRALLNLGDPSAAARQVIQQGLSVRETEALSQKETKTRRRDAAAPIAPEPGSADVAALERSLEESLGLPVVIRHGANGGELRIRYQTLEQLDSLCKSLTGQ
jgi:ParB family transcriptional regulator, chromosome partitioning protein